MADNASPQRGDRGSFRRLIVVLLLASCTACTVGPNFKAPIAKVPADFADQQRVTAAQAASSRPADTTNTILSATTSADPNPQWWHDFGDPELDSLVQRAQSGNLNLQEAVLRILASRAQEQSARAAGLPKLNATGSYEREQLGAKGILQADGAYSQIDKLGAPGSALENAAPGAGVAASTAANNVLNGLTAPTSLYQIGFDASWELDLFGRVRRATEAANAQTQAALENRRDALVSLEAEVARTYVQLRGAQALQQITGHEIEMDRQVVELTRSQQQSGLARQSEVDAAVAQLSTLQASLPQYEQQIDQAMNGLSVLLGQPPGSLDHELGIAAPVPPVPPQVPVGLPSSLARRRPDVRRAEADLHAATANVGGAIAALFPDISLTGEFGFRNTQASYLTRWASNFYSFGPQVSLPIFEGGMLRAQIKMARADQAVAVLQYRQAVLTALQDVDNALVSYRTDQGALDATERTVDANQRSFDLAANGYRHGLASFIEVLDAERQLADSRNQAARLTAQVSTDLIALYKALGGGWQETGTQSGSPSGQQTVQPPQLG